MADVDKGRQFAKLAAIVGGVMLIVAIIAVNKLGSNKAAPSQLPQMVQSGESPTEMTPSYANKIGDYNDQKRDAAKASGTTALPVLSPVKVVSNAGAGEGGAQGQGEGQPAPQYQNQLEQQARLQIEQQRASAMAQQVQMLLGQWAPPKQVTETNSVPRAADTQKTVATSPGSSAPSASGTTQKRVLVANGDRLGFARLDTPINTDEPSLVKATIISGPFAKGSVSGSHSKVGESVKITFTTLTHGGRSYAINAIALDIDTSKSLLSGEIDRKIMERFGWPFVAALVSGAGQAAAVSNSTTTIGLAGVTTASQQASSRQIVGAALGQGANAVAQQFNQSAARAQVSVKIPSDTPIALHLLADLIDDSANVSSATSTVSASVSSLSTGAPASPADIPAAAVPVVVQPVRSTVLPPGIIVSPTAVNQIYGTSAR